MKAGIFPHGATQWEAHEEQGNLWRETSFALQLLRQAINPRLNLAASIKDWGNIQKKLSENPRNRKRYHEKMKSLS